MGRPLLFMHNGSRYFLTDFCMMYKRRQTMIDWHKSHVEFWKSKLGVSDYGMLWIAFVECILFGLIVYHLVVAA